MSLMEDRKSSKSSNDDMINDNKSSLLEANNSNILYSSLQDRLKSKEIRDQEIVVEDSNDENKEDNASMKDKKLFICNKMIIILGIIIFSVILTVVILMIAYK